MKKRKEVKKQTGKTGKRRTKERYCKKNIKHEKETGTKERKEHK